MSHPDFLDTPHWRGEKFRMAHKTHSPKVPFYLTNLFILSVPARYFVNALLIKNVDFPVKIIFNNLQEHSAAFRL